ncbi:hypothetical protein BpHYR1_025813 [Brachionus plicatilis]|uniref:Uncharacterized protein n=1 Tax=Brachionus plicatilis TaxID=10195 RepID=A0A3M7P5A9_BRAPC|nr:hypothetical protein BpHYR1_025813 [Brachionus plicatilis]
MVVFYSNLLIINYSFEFSPLRPLLFWMSQSPDFIENKLAQTFIEQPLIQIIYSSFIFEILSLNE